VYDAETTIISAPKIMDNPAEDSATRLLVERHIAEIEERMRALETVIKQLEASGNDATNQAHLLADMAAALSTVVDFKARM
jgi:ferritin-like metal-binding protein YciE